MLLVLGMVEHLDLKPATPTQILLDQIRGALAGAVAEADIEGLEREAMRARAVSGLVKTLKDLQSLADAERARSEADDGESRTEFLRRMAQFMGPERGAQLLARLEQEGPGPDQS